MKNWVKLLISIALPLMVSAAAGYFTVTGLGSWYQNLQKPSWNPPNWLFGPVWTVLYIMMGIAFYLVWRSGAAVRTKQKAMGAWIVQLVLNFLWSFIFFNQHAIGSALIEIIILWLAILVTIFLFARCSKAAAWLLVPYISWVSFAAFLTYTIWILNK